MMLAKEWAAKPHQEIGRRIKLRIASRLKHLCATGFWWCNDCERVTERIESDHGQPHFCERCQSNSLTYHPPAAD